MFCHQDGLPGSYAHLERELMILKETLKRTR